jgi:amidase/aspartyl-tRNA(Asn)/glutamyl-tRNA(Gln) amidotransferase subunit A
MDHVAFFAREIPQVAKILEAGAGPDPADPASLQAAGSDNYDSVGYIDSVQDPPNLSELTLGVVSEGLGDGVKDYVVDTIESATEALKTEDATISHVSIDHFQDARAINENISYTELAAHWIANGSQHRRGGVIDARSQANLANAMEGASGKLGEYYKSKLLAGAQLIESHHSRYYTQAQAARQTLRSEFTQALEDVDVLLYPSAPAVAPTFEEVTDTSIDFARNTRQATVTRFPAITLPYGEHEGLPTSLQMVTNPFQENKLLGIAKTVHDSLN